MKQKCLILIMAFMLAGCIDTPSEDNTCTKTFGTKAIEVRQGVYMTNNIDALPLPTKGYDVYIIGEEHGIHEIHMLFINYLYRLHQDTGIQHIILEESQYGKEKIEEYVLGISDTPWSNRLLEELLRAIRELNQTLPNNEKIHVHPVDIYPDIHIIYDHLKVLQKKIGMPAERVEMPSFEKFEEWNKEEILVLIDAFIGISNNDSIINQLKTARASIQFYFADTVQFQTAIREEIIAQNIFYLLRDVNTPVLALYGHWHAKKSSSVKIHPYTNSWTNRLTKKRIKIYSLFATGITGTRLSPISRTVVPFSEDPEQVIFPDGTTLSTILDENPDCNIVYIDFLSRNESIQITFDQSIMVPFNQNEPAGMSFDGMVIFRYISPVQAGKENENEKILSVE